MRDERQGMRDERQEMRDERQEMRDEGLLAVHIHKARPHHIDAMPETGRPRVY